MSFTDEVKQVLASPEYKAEAAPAAKPEVKAVIEPPAASGESVFNEGMQEATPEPVAAAPAAAQPVIEQPKGEARVRIGGQEFASVEEAIKYANDLELAVLQQDAFIAGKAEAAKVPETPPVDPYKEQLTKIANGVFEDPEKAIDEILKVAEQRAEEKIKKAKEEDEKRTQQVETTKKLWNQFYDKNADLAASHDVVQYVLEKNWTQLEKMKADDALPLLAEKTRALLGSYKETVLPSKELQSKPAITAGTSNNATNSAPPKPKTALDFISQVNKLRKRETAQNV